MAKCPLCSRRSAKRWCPAKSVKICPICCGSKREVEIDCPSDCVYLRQGRNFESQERPVVGRGPRREFGQQFRHRYALHITTLAQAILEERNRAPSLTDKDVLDAFEALKATAKTLSAGIHYETVPEGGSAAIGLYRRAKALVEEMMQPQESGYEALRASDAPDVLDFIVVSVELHSAGRPRSRRYLDWLSSMAPAPVEDDPAGGLIVP